MYKYYNKFQSQSIVNVFEFKPSDTLIPVACYEETRKPITKVKHEWLEKKGWKRLAGVNLSFFGMETLKSQIIGVNYIDGGFTLTSPAQTGFPAYELAYKDKELIIGDMTEKYFREQIENKASWGVSLSYSLILDGKIDIRNEEYFDHYKYRHPRTCIGQKADGTIVLCVIDGRSSKSKGATAKQSAKIMLSLGCVKAINADGGGSSIMLYKDRVVNCYPYRYVRPVPNALLVYTKDDIITELRDLPQLSWSCRGEYVEMLQKALLGLGFSLGKYGVDGSFGYLTFRAVKLYQKSRGLKVDGIAGPNTWRKLSQEVDL